MISTNKIRVSSIDDHEKVHPANHQTRLSILLLFMLHKHAIAALGRRPVVPMTSSGLLLITVPSLAVPVCPALLGVGVIHQQLAVLAVAPRLHLGLVHDLEHALPAGLDVVEDTIHLLETAVRRLRVEEVDRGHHEGVDDGEDDVGLVADGVEGDGGDHDDHEVEDPVGRRRQCVGGRADFERHDLRGVQPSHSKPANSEEGVEDEQEDDARYGAAFIILIRVDARQDRHRACLASCAKEHKLSPADTLHEEDCGPGGEEIFGAVEGGKQTGHEVGHAQIAVDDGRVVRDEVDSRNLLEHLVDVGEQRAMQIAVLAHCKQIGECALGHLKDCVFDFVKLAVDRLVVDILVAQRGEDLACVVLAPLEDEPPRGLGKAPDEGENKYAEKDLKGQGESPSHRTRGKGEAEVDPV